jgi:DNA-binding NarL/FixJ family response regulator
MNELISPAPVHRGPRDLNVVLVEDHAGYREQLRQLFEGLEGVRVVHTADRVQDILGWLSDHPRGWDLLVLDIFLAEGHGYQVLRACRDRQAHQRAVLLTSYTREPAASQAITLGADAVFDKTTGTSLLLRYATELQQASQLPVIMDPATHP